MSDITYHLVSARQDELLRVAADRRRAREVKASAAARVREPARGARIRRVSRLARPRWATH